jgi:hypothetical protein
MANFVLPPGVSRRYVQYHALRARQNDSADDVPSRMLDGWRIGDRHYKSDGTRRTRHGFDAAADFVVTRPDGYVPYQSVVQPDGRYAYDPHQEYPERSIDELREGRLASDHGIRQTEFALNRSGHYMHHPGEEVVMGFDYSQMRTHPGHPVLLPGLAAVQGCMGPPPDPRYPAGGYGGYGGYHGGWR